MKIRPLALLLVNVSLLALQPLRLELMAQQATAKPAVTAAARAPSATTVHYVKVVGIDYSFESPDAVSSGIVTFNLVNSGSDLHAIAVFELPSNHTLREFLDQYHAQGMIPSWMNGVGQTATIAPKAETFLTARLTPGKYIIACLIPARDGRMHTEKGMVKLITVR